MPGKASASKASKGKSASKVAGRRGRVAGSKAPRRRPQPTFHTYIYKVLKTVAKGKTLKKSTMTTLNSVVHDIFGRLATEAGNLCRHNKRGTLGSHEVGLATRMVLPGDLAKQAGQEGEGAVLKFRAATR